MEENMGYEEFLTAVKIGLQEHLGNICKVTVKKNIREDGSVGDAVYIDKAGEASKPNLYLNVYYQLYQQGMSVDAILHEITEVYQWREAPLCTPISAESGGLSFVVFNYIHQFNDHFHLIIRQISGELNP